MTYLQSEVMKTDYIQGLLTALKEADTDTRIKVASALRMLEDKRTTEGLIKALDDECEEVRHEAVRALSCARQLRCGVVYD